MGPVYGYVLKKKDLYAPLRYDLKCVKMKNAMPIAKAAMQIGVDYKVLKELDSHILGKKFPRGTYLVKLPVGRNEIMGKLVGKFNRALSHRGKKASRRIYKVRPGDTLTDISRKTGVSIEHIKNLNQLKGISFIEALYRILNLAGPRIRELGNYCERRWRPCSMLS